MWNGDEARRHEARRYVPQASDLSRPLPPDYFPEPNVPGGSDLLGGRQMIDYPTYQIQETQQIGYQLRDPRALPPPFPVQPPYTTGGNASVVTGHVNHTRSHAAYPHSQVQAYSPQHPAHSPPYFYGNGGFVGDPDTLQGPSYDSHGLSYEHVRSRAPEIYPRPPNPPGWPSTTPAQMQPALPHNVGFEYQAFAQLYTPRGPRKRALVVGINYSTHRDVRFRLNWGVNDAREIARFLQERCGFDRNDIRILTDDQPNNLPTKANILAAMRWLVEGARPGDSLFFYFSGHATQVEDLDDEEPDGFDECLCTMEFTGNNQPLFSTSTPGIIVDDLMHDIMVKPLPRGCRLTAVFDCCHSGTLLDLPFIYDSQGRLKPYDPEVVGQKSSEADVISLSACKDKERAFEAREGGALRKAFIEYMTTSESPGTYLDLIQSHRGYMYRHGFNQRPQLSSSHWIDINQLFII